jgi:DNA-binding CsgD family transcriptional regulator
MRMPVLAIGGDRSWRQRMDRILRTRAGTAWLGAYAPAQAHPSAAPGALLLLLDGDDPAVERAPRRPLLQPPDRLYFYRDPRAESLRRCARTGARGCLEKFASAEEILRALRAIEAGLFAVEPALLRLIVDGPDATPANMRSPMAHDADFPQLTERQREIVRWATRGLSTKRIARVLGISPETVKTHLHNIFEREGVHSRIALLAARHVDWKEGRSAPS